MKIIKNKLLVLLFLSWLSMDGLHAEIGFTDIIVRKNHHRIERIIVTAEEYSEVRYSLPGPRSNALSSKVATEKVLSVIYGDEPLAYRKARENLERGEYERALTKFGEAAKSKARSWLSIAIEFGKAECLRHLNRFKEAESHYQEVLSKAPRARQAPNAVIGLAQCYIGLGGEFLNKAVLQYEKLEDGTYGDGWKPFGTFGKGIVKKNQGKLSLKAGRKEEAENLFNDALFVFQMLIDSLKIDKGKDKALDHLFFSTKVIKGRVLIAQNKVDVAELWFNALVKEARNANVGVAEAYNGRGDMLFHMGQAQRALLDFIRVATVHFADPVSHQYGLKRCVELFNHVGDKKREKEYAALYKSYYPHAKIRIPSYKNIAKPEKPKKRESLQKRVGDESKKKQVKILEDSKAFLGKKIVGQIQKGQVFELIEVRGDWVCIQLANKESGWIPKKICQLDADKDTEAKKPNVIGNGQGNITILRDTKVQLGSKIVAQVKKGEKYSVISKKGNWFSISVKVDTNQVKGWVNGKDVSYSP